MNSDLKLNKILWSVTTAMVFIAALAGIIDRSIYDAVFAPEYLPGAFLQDILTLAVSIVLFVLITTVKENDVRKKVVIIGLIGGFCYLYGILTIERVYNSFYLLYLGIFAMSFWSIVYSLAGFKSESYATMKINGAMVKVTAASSIIIAVIFTFLWIMTLIPLMQEHNRIEYLYSIFILDLCFIMPAYFMTAVMSLRKKPFGILMGPALMILGFFVIFPLGLNELAKPSFGMAINYGSMIVSFAFSAAMLTIGVLHLRMLRFE